MRPKIDEVPSLKDFIKNQTTTEHDHDEKTKVQDEIDESTLPEYLHIEREVNKHKKFFIETHGC